ncbi:MAG TPA: valine--tRNA ligase [Candidatus Nanoarchaeia archaeon]|nr:valine--tRNA ligase [Candidatus Nanoarchaeia archaeon]
MDKPKTYNPQEAEKKWQQHWEKEKLYKFIQPKNTKDIFSIDTPPPTLSGAMHIGHAFSYCQGDFIARFQRMLGKQVLCPFGTDDNGLPTERLVEKLKNVKGTHMEREAFVKLCEKTVLELKKDFVQPWKDLGISCDFEQSYSTIDRHSLKVSQYSFLDLYHKGRIYREESPVAWCTTCQTAIAQAEFDNIEQASTFNNIVFKVHDKELIISTTRPELLPACVALMIHPSHKQYKEFKGKFAKVPLFDYEVPILADEKVDPTKGTGIVMCCTFGDKVDIEWWRKYKLPLRIIFEKHGKMNSLAKQYQGKTLKETRKEILKALQDQKLLIKQQPIQHAVNVHERCGTEIEFLKTHQLYIRVLDMKEELIEAADKIQWHPEFMKKRYIHWVENLNWDWCISRQRFYGVPFPLWYCKKCSNIILADAKDLPLDPLSHKPKKACDCGSKEFIPEQDVMDTWTTSSVTPQIVLDWPANEKQFTALSPMSYRFQAHDIIRVWTFYTIVKSLYHHKKVPWTTIGISGYVLDPKGEKMSKSKGNVIDPQTIYHKFSADALRYWSANFKLGEDISYQEKDVMTGQKTVTKLWNAAQFVTSHLAEKPTNKQKLELMDQWLLTRLQQLIQDCTESFNQYSFWIVKSAVDNFFWHTFCDDYLEIVKDRLYNPDKRGKEARASAQFTLHTALLTLLKLFAPIMPYITEEIYMQLFSKEEKTKSIHISSWPTVDKKLISEETLVVGDRFVQILAEVRQFKSKQQVSLKAEVILTLEKKDYTLLEPVFADLRATCQAREIKQGNSKIELY